MKIHIAFLIPFLIGTITALTTGCTPSKTEEQDRIRMEKFVPVSVQSIQLTEFEWRETYLGVVAPIHEAKLTTVVGGWVDRLFVKDGDRVKRGQPLCDIDAPLLTARRDAAQLAFELAQQDLEAIQVHQKAGTASKKEVSLIKQSLLNQKAQLIESERRLEGAQCITPIQGIVATHFIAPFQLVGPGTPTVTVIDISRVKILIGIPEDHISGYKNGNTAWVSQSDGHLLKGHVTAIAQTLKAVDRTFEVEVQINNRDHKLKPGNTVQVELLRRILRDQVVVPTSAIMTLSNGQAVMIVADGIARRKPVETGPSSGDLTVITRGLRSKDLLIVKGFEQATDGAKVQWASSEKNLSQAIHHQ